MARSTSRLTRERSDARLGELVLHVASACEQDPTLGATKLNRILFFASFLGYPNLGKPITGQDYQALEQGPTPQRFSYHCCSG